MQVVPPWALGLLCLSKRLHSIYMLRLFNDCVAMLLAYAATALLLERCWRSAALMYSAAVSVKMSVLLMAPPVLVVMLKVPNALMACTRLGRPCPIAMFEARGQLQYIESALALCMFSHVRSS